MISNLINYNQQHNATEVTLNLFSDMITDSKDETYFPHILLLADRQLSKLRKAFTSNSSATIKS